MPPSGCKLAQTAPGAGDPRNLGPGSYNVPMDWASRSKHGTYKPIPGFGSAELSLIHISEPTRPY